MSYQHGPRKYNLLTKVRLGEDCAERFNAWKRAHLAVVAAKLTSSTWVWLSTSLRPRPCSWLWSTSEAWTTIAGFPDERLTVVWPGGRSTRCLKMTDFCSALTPSQLGICFTFLPSQCCLSATLHICLKDVCPRAQVRTSVVSTEWVINYFA